MNLSEITPLVITYNEAPNIGRCLERLAWAHRVLVFDSGSTDETLQICAAFPNVAVFYRRFDTFAGQCNAGMGHIASEWVLSIDADYILPESFPETLTKLQANADGYQFPFRYCIHGHPLRSSLYPPRTVLYKRSKATYRNDGHGHRVEISGTIKSMSSKIDHDDRKSLDRWLASQQRYAKLEARKMSHDDQTVGIADGLRKMIWPAVPAVFLYTFFAKRLILDGWPGLFYSLQRTYAELLLALNLLERRIVNEPEATTASRHE